MSRLKFSLEEFCKITREVVESLPPPFQEQLENVVVDVQDEPTPHDLEALSEREDRGEMETTELLGLFIGTPLTEQHFNEHAWNTIKIFRFPIERISRTKEEVAKQIHDTVLHELAHHFGYEEEDLEDFEASR